MIQTVSIGADVDDFHLPAKEALGAAARLQFRDVEVGVGSGELSPENLSVSGRRHLARFAEGLGLRLVALTADMPALRLTDPSQADQRVQRTRAALEMARQIGVKNVTASVGAIAHPRTGEPSGVAMEALARIGEVADGCGVAFAMRPTHDAGERLVQILRTLNCPGITIGLDPAALVMVGADPLASIEQFAERITIVHARDATAGAVDRERDEARAGRETRLGEGDVDLVGLLEVLRDADFRGPYILRRTDSRSAIDDLQAGRETLQKLLR